MIILNFNHKTTIAQLRFSQNSSWKHSSCALFTTNPSNNFIQQVNHYKSDWHSLLPVCHSVSKSGTPDGASAQQKHSKNKQAPQIAADMQVLHQHTGASPACRCFTKLHQSLTSRILAPPPPPYRYPSPPHASSLRQVASDLRRLLEVVHNNTLHAALIPHV
eukprot:Selendium_serpulae@DN8210_c0_g1_i1.p1